ncbi:ATP-binding protein [Thioclava sp. GXIMD4216]|uniref:ATP-binding protein n=1 Tax=unclassified Thioclava TaxID=2621713 RepID=UPI0030CC69F3
MSSREAGHSIDYRREIDRLMRLEFGSRSELVLRYLAVFNGGLTLHFYLQWTSALLWMPVYFALQALYYVFLRSRAPVCTARDTTIASILFLVLLGWFSWLPALMLLEQDTALRISAAAGLGCLMVFLIRRSDRLKLMIYGEIVMITLILGAVAFLVLPQVPSLSAKSAMLVCCAALIVYFANALLEGRKMRLDAERASERTLQAQKMEAVGQLAGGVAHDFNNILTAIIGNLDLYELTEDRPERDDMVHNAREAAQRAATLVQQLLAYSRKSNLQSEPRDIEVMLERVRVLGARLIPASISLEVINSPRRNWVKVDETLLMTALINLIVNARDAMPKGGRIRISADHRCFESPELMADGYVLPAGNYVELTVADTGTGIPETVLDHVLEPFFTTKPVGKGSGLGLPMVLGFARQSGGGLSLRSSAAGTHVSVYLKEVEAPLNLVANRAA